MSASRRHQIIESPRRCSRGSHHDVYFVCVPQRSKNLTCLRGARIQMRLIHDDQIPENLEKCSKSIVALQKVDRGDHYVK